MNAVWLAGYRVESDRTDPDRHDRAVLAARLAGLHRPCRRPEGWAIPSGERSHQL